MDRDIHEQAGFESVVEYLADVVSTEMPNIGRDPEQRRKLVAILTEHGWSQRAIGKAVGVNQSTVDRDPDQLMHDASVEQPDNVRCLDDKRRRAHPKRDPKPKPPPLPADAQFKQLHVMTGSVAGFANWVSDIDLVITAGQAAEIVDDLREALPVLNGLYDRLLEWAGKPSPGGIR